MERRSFLKLSSAFAATLSYKAAAMPLQSDDDREPPAGAILTPSYKVHPDGTFDISTGAITLLHCLPFADESRIAPLSIAVNSTAIATEVLYTLKQGIVRLRFEVNKQLLSIKATLEGMPQAPHFFYPVSSTNVDGVNRCYQQGLGFGGPSGIRDLTSVSEAVAYDSYMISALLSADDTTMVVSAADYNQFIHRSQAYTRLFRTDLTHRTTDAHHIGFDSGFATEHKPVDGVLELPALLISGAKIPFRAMRRHARIVAESNTISLPKPSRYHYCSWYEFEKDFSRQRLSEVLDGLATIAPAIPLQTIQIDAGYCLQGDWLVPNDKWPGGLKDAFDAIRSRGYKAGIWVAPFMVQKSSNLYRNHPDWVIRDTSGNPIVEWDKAEDQWFYLDASHPEAFEYVRTVFRTLKSWGADYFKLDFLDWGLKDSVRFQKATKGYTSVESFRKMLRMIREEIGDESFLLACIAPFQAVFGIADGVRIANDVAPNWGSALNMFNESFAGQYYNNIWWQNDNDVVYLRSEHNQLSPVEQATLALWNGFLGGIVNTSDRLHTLAPDSLKFWRFLEPQEQKPLVYIHQWQKPGSPRIARRWYKEQKSFALLLINDTNATADITLDFSEITRYKQPSVYNWKVFGSTSLGRQTSMNLSIAPHDNLLLYINDTNTPPPNNMTLAGKLVVV